MNNSAARSSHAAKLIKSKKAKLAKALARGESVRQKMATSEGGNISVDEAAHLLGRSKAFVMKQFRAGKLIGWKAKDEMRFPVWQFVGRKRLAGLEKVLATLADGDVLDDWGKVGFFLLTHGLLDERRPLDLLREKKLEPVLKAAEAYGG